ncbi:MAG: carboxypeptidase-like regulatory domain-containing protein, partial [Candidatus Thermoplasmatota archaeon]|nr:carboxypeptidase-like regulatory domain-containing protein [Candidatus Thermoplasmatota archaeon]
GGTAEDKAQGYDVAAGFLDTNGNIHDEDNRYVSSVRVSGGRLYADIDDYRPAKYCDAISGDETTAYGTGAVKELDWNLNGDGNDPSNYYSAVSYVGGTPERKVLYFSHGLVTFSCYVVFVGYNYNDIVGNLTKAFKAITKFFCPSTYLGSTRIEGKVTYGGAALVNATVQAYSAADPTVLLGAAITDSGGMYKLAITPGTYNLRAFKRWYSTEVITGVTVAAGEVVTGKDFALSANVGAIEGTVKIDHPVFGALKVGGIHVKAEGAVTKEAITINGYYHIDDLPAGTYTVTAYDLMYVNASYTYSGVQSKSTAGVTVTAGVYTSDIDFVLTTGMLSGRVTDTANKPIKNAFVYMVESDKSLEQDPLEYPNSVLRWAITDERGYYSMLFIGDNAKGYKLRARADGEYQFYRYNTTSNEYETLVQTYGYFNESYKEGVETIVYVIWGKE